MISKICHQDLLRFTFKKMNAILNDLFPRFLTHFCVSFCIIFPLIKNYSPIIKLCYLWIAILAVTSFDIYKMYLLSNNYLVLWVRCWRNCARLYRWKWTKWRPRAACQNFTFWNISILQFYVYFKAVFQ